MNWSSERPKDVGLYWAREKNGGNVVIVEQVQDPMRPERLAIHGMGSHYTIYDTNFDLWSERVEPPRPESKPKELLPCHCGPENERRGFPCANCMMGATVESFSGWRSKFR